MSEIPFREPGRRTPAKGVHVSFSGPNWVFLTVCTEKRERWLAQASVQCALHDIWQNTATAWLVSDYLLMPDHLHLFCAPHDLKFTIERWMAFLEGSLRQNASGHGDVSGGRISSSPARWRKLFPEMAIRPRESGACGIGDASRRLAIFRLRA